MHPTRRVVNIEPGRVRNHDRMRRPPEPIPVNIDLVWDEGSEETVPAHLIGWYAETVDGQERMRSAFVEWTSDRLYTRAAVLPARYVRRRTEARP